MQTTLSPEVLAAISEPLAESNLAFARSYPGEPTSRQPVHVVYGGAQLFSYDTAPKLGRLALKALEQDAPDAATLGAVLDLPARLQEPVWERVQAKLKREPIEDLRIDFEDGYGLRTDEEEDAHAVKAAQELAKGLAEGTLSPFIGLRIKSLAAQTHRRALRTLDLFVTTLVRATGGKLPPGFVVTLPKVQHQTQVRTADIAFEALERGLGLKAGALKLELMVELTQTLVGADGVMQLPRLVDAAEGRCIAAHFGTYDYTASCNITSADQKMTHPACDFARHVMQVCLARTGLFLSDGATNVMPIGPHRGPTLTEAQRAENRAAVHAAWRLSAANLRDSLQRGFYQGWDLHPAQVPIRYATMYAFFLGAVDEAAARLKGFVDRAARATLLGGVFDDEATGQGLLNFFNRALACGAMTEAEASAHTGLTAEELGSRSFERLVRARR